MDTDKILSEQFVAKYSAEAAQAVESLTDDDIAALLEVMPLGLTAKLIRQLQAYRGANCLRLVNPERANALIEQLDIADAESLLRHCEIPFRTELLNSISPKRADILSEKLEYRIESVGAWMTPSVFALHEAILVGDATGMVALEKERISATILIVDGEDKLVGDIPLSTLFFADQVAQLAAIMRTRPPSIFADAPIKSVENHPAWHDYLAIPVIDRPGRLIGILTVENYQRSAAEPNEGLSKEVLETSSALGELYRIGLTGFLQSISK